MPIGHDWHIHLVSSWTKQINFGFRMKYLLSWVEIEDANENAINTSWKYKLVNTRSISVKDRNKIYSRNEHKMESQGFSQMESLGEFVKMSSDWWYNLSKKKSSTDELRLRADFKYTLNFYFSILSHKQANCPWHLPIQVAAVLLLRRKHLTSWNTFPQ